jgi:hypothetical protein
MQTYADCTPMRFAWQLRSKQRTENGLGLRNFIFLNDSTFHSDIDVCFQYMFQSHMFHPFTHHVLWNIWNSCLLFGCQIPASRHGMIRGHREMHALPCFGQEGTSIVQPGSSWNSFRPQDIARCRWMQMTSWRTRLSWQYSILFDASREHHELGIDNV